MPIQGNITLNTKVYTPRGTESGISSWALSGDATFGGAQSRLTESVRDVISSSLTRSKFMLYVPKAAEADSSCACQGAILGTGKAEVTVDVPVAFTAAERQDFCDRIQALVADAIFDKAVAEGEGSWG